MRRILCLLTTVLCFSTTALTTANCGAQRSTPEKEGLLQIALTFDDLPAHGQIPPGVTRLEIAQSILAILKREKLPPV